MGIYYPFSLGIPIGTSGLNSLRYVTQIGLLGVCLIVAWAVMFFFFWTFCVSAGQSVIKRNCCSLCYFYGLLVFGLSRCSKPHDDVQLHKDLTYFGMGIFFLVSNASGRGEIKFWNVGEVDLYFRCYLRSNTNFWIFDAIKIRGRRTPKTWELVKYR